MALRIRLKRMGRKKSPHYRIVIAESTMPRDGRNVATIGHYNPTTNPVLLKVDRDKALAWLARGAVATDTVQSLLKKAGVFQPAPATGIEAVTAAVTEVAGKAAKAVKGAAQAVAGTVGGAASAVASAVAGTVGDAAGSAVDAMKDAAGAIVETVRGSDDEAEAPAETPAAEGDAPEAAATVPGADSDVVESEGETKAEGE
jgi:small subunit ribosomal protein S16